MQCKSARELKSGEEVGEGTMLSKVAQMTGPDRTMAERLHKIIKASVPSLTPKLWYGMHAHARDANMICFFQPGKKYMTVLNIRLQRQRESRRRHMWPTARALNELIPPEETRIRALVKKAFS